MFFPLQTVSSWTKIIYIKKSDKNVKQKTSHKQKELNDRGMPSV